jgi:hypothetical protein
MCRMLGWQLEDCFRTLEFHASLPRLFAQRYSAAFVTDFEGAAYIAIKQLKSCTLIADFLARIMSLKNSTGPVQPCGFVMFFSQ